MGGRELTDAALRDELIRMFGSAGTVKLLGWCAIFALAGCRSVRQMRDLRFGSTAARYKAVADLVVFARYLREDRGYDLGSGEEAGAELGAADVVRGLAPAI